MRNNSNKLCNKPVDENRYPNCIYVRFE